jgi:hypothetical protein
VELLWGAQRRSDHSVATLNVELRGLPLRHPWRGIVVDELGADSVNGTLPVLRLFFPPTETDRSTPRYTFAISGGVHGDEPGTAAALFLAQLLADPRRLRLFDPELQRVLSESAVYITPAVFPRAFAERQRLGTARLVTTGRVEPVNGNRTFVPQSPTTAEAAAYMGAFRGVVLDGHFDLHGWWVDSGLGMISHGQHAATLFQRVSDALTGDGGRSVSLLATPSPADLRHLVSGQHAWVRDPYSRYDFRDRIAPDGTPSPAGTAPVAGSLFTVGSPGTLKEFMGLQSWVSTTLEAKMADPPWRQQVGLATIVLESLRQVARLRAELAGQGPGQ